MAVDQEVGEFVNQVVDDLSQGAEDVEPDIGELKLFSHLYGLARREQQFQEFYEAYSRLHRYLTKGSFRQGTGRVEDATEQFVEAANTYFGMEMSEEEFTLDYSHLASNPGHIPAGFRRIIEEAEQYETGRVKEEDMREILSDI